MDAEASTLLRALVCLAALIAVIVQAQTPLHHLVLMALGVVAVNAQIKVLKEIRIIYIVF